MKRNYFAELEEMKKNPSEYYLSLTKEYSDEEILKIWEALDFLKNFANDSIIFDNKKGYGCIYDGGSNIWDTICDFEESLLMEENEEN